MFFEWGKEFETGVPQMDKQHKNLFKLAKEFYTALKSSNRDKAREKLLAFTNALKAHLIDEERFMEEIKFPELEDHKKLHQNLREMIEEVKEEFERNDHKAYQRSISLIMSWLFTHIKKSDKKYGEFIIHSIHGKKIR